MEERLARTPRGLRERAERIITMNRYMTLPTVDGGGPWIAPVAYVTDLRGDFCWASRCDARHSRCIELGHSAAIAVFDSTANYEG